MNEWSLMVLFKVQSYAQRGKSGRGKKKLLGKASCIYMAEKTGVGESQEL